MSPYVKINNTRTPSSFLFFIALYLVIELLLYATLPSDKHFAPDSVGYIIPAKAFAAQAVDDLGIRLPGYPLLLSIPLRLGLDLIPTIVFIQVFLNLACAICAAMVSKMVINRCSLAVFIMTLYNPYGLISTQLILPEVFFSAILSLQTVILLVGCEKKSALYIAISGMLAGFLIVTRANAMVLLCLCPLLVVIFLLKNKSNKIITHTIFLASFVFAATIVLAPWVGYVYKKTDNIALISPSYTQLARYEAIRFLDMLLGRSTEETSREYTNRNICGVIDKNDASCEQRPAGEMYKFATDNFAEILRSYKITELSFGLSKSLFSYFFSTGYTLIASRINLPHLVDKIVSVALLCFVLVVRLFDLTGIYYAVKKRDIYVLFFFGMYVALFALPIGFFGMARYRYPLDFIFFILACYGCHELFRGLRASQHIKIKTI